MPKKAKKEGEFVEIRWHGRGGQGVVTASELLAETALEEGKYFQAFPDYGPERMGAPIRAYTRISGSPILQHCQITDPDVVIVLDPTLIGIVDFTVGLKENGALVVNTPLSPAELRQQLGFKKGKVYTVDATRISLETMGRNMPNTPIIGALLQANPVVSKEKLIDATRERLAARLNQGMAEKNLEALNRAFNEVKAG